MTALLEEIFDVPGTVALVTLAGCGATVVAADLDEARLEELDGVDPVHLDVSDAIAVEDAVSEIAHRHGRLDTVFANAGTGARSSAAWRTRFTTPALATAGPAGSVSPGRRASPEPEARWGASVALGRMGDPRELRGLALFFASRASSFVTGSVYAVDGGALLQSTALDPAPEGT